LPSQEGALSSLSKPPLSAGVDQLRERGVLESLRMLEGSTWASARGPPRARRRGDRRVAHAPGHDRTRVDASREAGRRRGQRTRHELKAAPASTLLDAAVSSFLRTVILEWFAWCGDTFWGFCEHLREHHQLLFGRTKIASILEQTGLRILPERPGRSPHDEAMRGAFESFYPDAIWTADGCELTIDLEGQRSPSTSSSRSTPTAGLRGRRRARQRERRRGPRADRGPARARRASSVLVFGHQQGRRGRGQPDGPTTVALAGRPDLTPNSQTNWRSPFG
jgi:hypothetical protein